MSAVGMCREQILHLWSINTLTGETTPPFLFYFISMLAKFSLNLTRCWALMRHFMKCKNYRKFFGCKIEGMHSGWVVWYSVVKNIALFNNLPCHGKYALGNVNNHDLFNHQARVHLSCILVSPKRNQGRPTTIFGRISVRKTIWDLEFSKHLL